MIKKKSSFKTTLITVLISVTFAYFPSCKGSSKIEKFIDGIQSNNSDKVWELTHPDSTDKTKLPEEKEESRKQFADSWKVKINDFPFELKPIFSPSAKWEVFASKSKDKITEDYIVVEYPKLETAYRPKKWRAVKKLKLRAITSEDGKITSMNIEKILKYYDSEELRKEGFLGELESIIDDGIQSSLNLSETGLKYVKTSELKSLTSGARILEDGRIVEEGGYSKSAGVYFFGKVRNDLEFHSATVKVFVDIKTTKHSNMRTGSTFFDFLGSMAGALNRTEHNKYVRSKIIKDLAPRQTEKFAIYFPDVSGSFAISSRGVNFSSSKKITGRNVFFMFLPNKEQRTVMEKIFFQKIKTDIENGKSLGESIVKLRSIFGDTDFSKKVEVQVAKLFFEKNGKLRTTPSGLQYIVIRAGTGKTPNATDTVRIHFKGTLLDGTDIGNSYKYNKGQPVNFPLKYGIPGWSEGIQLMKVGAKYRFLIPPKLGFGKKGSKSKMPIPPNAFLIFEVELFGIKK